jgi:hypothetical protein
VLDPFAEEAPYARTMTFAPEQGPTKSSRQRFFDEDSVAKQNWLTGRARKLAFCVGGELEGILNGLADRQESDFPAPDQTQTNSPLVAPLVRFFLDHGPADVREVLERTFIGMSEEFEKPAKACAAGRHHEYTGHLITINAEMEYDLARIADVGAAYMEVLRAGRRGLAAELRLATRLLFQCVDIVGYRIGLTLDAFDWYPSDYRSDFDRQAGEFFVWGLMFVLGHELGHHVLGHTEPRSIEIEPRESQEHELAADAFAAQAIFESVNAHPDYEGFPVPMLAGPLVALTALAVEHVDGTTDRTTHPSDSRRWRNVLQASSAYLTSDELETMERLGDTINGYLQGRLQLWPSSWWTSGTPSAAVPSSPDSAPA